MFGGMLTNSVLSVREQQPGHRFHSICANGPDHLWPGEGLILQDTVGSPDGDFYEFRPAGAFRHQ